MALKKIGKKPTLTKNGKDYYPFWESKTGKTIIQIENPSASDKPIFEDGKWNVNADTIGLTNQEKQYIGIQQNNLFLKHIISYLTLKVVQGNQRRMQLYHNG